MKTRKLCACACLTAAALGVFVLECQLPPISVLPGLKPGLSNIFTLVCMDLLGPGWALGLLLARILLGCALTGLCAQLCLQRLSRAHGLRLFHTNSDL